MSLLPASRACHALSFKKNGPADNTATQKLIPTRPTVVANNVLLPDYKYRGKRKDV